MNPQTRTNFNEIKKEKNIAMYFSGRVFSNDFEFFKTKLQSLPFYEKIIFFVSLNQSKEMTTKDHFFHNFCKELNISLPEQVNFELTPLQKFTAVLKNAINPFGSNVNNVASMFYHNKQCFNLIEKFSSTYNHKFDIVIRFRADIDIKSSLDISQYAIEDNTIYLSTHRWPIRKNDCDDCVAFGNYESMKKYSDVISNISRYCLNEKCTIHPETLMKYHLDSSALTTKEIPFEYALYSSRHKYDLYKNKVLMSKKNKKQNLSLNLINSSFVLGLTLLVFFLEKKLF